MRHQSWRARASARAEVTSTSRRCRRLVSTLLTAAFCAGGTTISLAQDGKAIFDAKCAACHSIGGGPKMGPDLKGVVAKRGKEGTVMAVVDPAKAGLQPSMPNLGVAKNDAEAIVAYLDQAQGAPVAAAASKEDAAPAAQAAAPHPDEVQRGQDLFEGKVRFAKGGPSCNACHDVKSDAIASGGLLASELTLVFSRMGSKGLQSILAKSPFPVMQVAYTDRELTEQEIVALVAFFQKVGKDYAGQMPMETGWKIFAAAICGVLVLLALLSLIGQGRKKRSVNQDIYDRQVKSE